MTEESGRPSAREIYEHVLEDARDELGRSPGRLAYSALLAGGMIGFSGLASALTLAALHGSAGAKFVAALVYPIGFLAVVLGRAQLFTENTLYPVALVLEERRHLVATLRLWAVVFAANTVGALLFAILITQSSAVTPEAVRSLDHLGGELAAGSFVANFWSAMIAGWLLALVAWLVEALHEGIAQAMAIWALTFLLAIGSFDHSVASTFEVLSTTLDGGITVGHAVAWIATATFGNVVGGVFIVSLLNYGQAKPD